MAKRITLLIKGKTEEEKSYVTQFLKNNTPEGWDTYEASISVYAANTYSPDIVGFFEKVARDLKLKGLSYVLEAEDAGYDRYEISADGVYYVGGYEYVIDDEGDPVAKYKEAERKKVA